jgi:hypothetical protein
VLADRAGAATIRATCSASAVGIAGRRRRRLADVEVEVEVGSSTQYGWSMPNGTSASRHRNGGSWSRRSPSRRQMSFWRSDPPGAVEGS